MKTAMTLPNASSAPATTNPAARASAADEHGDAHLKSCPRPRVKQLKEVTQPSHPTAPLVAGPAGSQPKRLSRSEREAAAKITRPCSECGRRFWSWKALFGHMRCHPDRPWRGIEPPPDSPRRSPELDVCSPPNYGAADGEVEAATCLILLKGEQTVVGSSSNSDELPPPSATPPRLGCFGCDKVFDTVARGLGGHGRGHAKTQTRDAATRKRKAAEEGVRRAVQLHKCDICSMRFSSGQALGGHMSSHWKGNREHRAAEAEPEAPTASSSTSTAGGCRFDLNLPAPE